MMMKRRKKSCDNDCLNEISNFKLLNIKKWETATTA